MTSLQGEVATWRVAGSVDGDELPVERVRLAASGEWVAVVTEEAADVVPTMARAPQGGLFAALA